MLLATAFPASAEPAGQIDSVQTRDGVVRILFSLRDLPSGTTPDLSSVQVSVNGAPQDATAELASNSGESPRRSVILAMDVSDSMAGERFTAAQQAALTFIQQAPDDVRIGIVSFAGTVTQVQPPTIDRDALVVAVESLHLARGTLLFQGLQKSVDVLAHAGSGSILVLSDGRDTSGAPAAEIIAALQDSAVHLDVVALEQSGAALAALEDLAAAGSGQVISADDNSLSQAFSAQAAQLKSQVLISYDVPAGWDGSDASLSASVAGDNVTYEDSALVNIPADASTQTDSDASPQFADVPEPFLQISRPMMLGGLAALAVGGVVLTLSLTNAFAGSEKQTLEGRLSGYTGGQGTGAMAPGGRAAPTYSTSVKQQAVELTERAISRGLDVSLGRRLDAAGLKLNSAEWLLLHAGGAVVAAAVGFLISGGRLLPTLLFLLLGAAVPWAYLSLKKSRRLKAFNSQLADTLQLIAGSLSAGLSLAQSLDTVVREGNEPIAGEFRRALVEQRLGVEIETALEGVAHRMCSDDFAWVVMAVRIQREVGGNLAELLTTVASTLREREYLRRQVSVLSAEGRLSAYILGGLPPLFIAYLALARPTYLAPMYTTGLGLLMSGTAAAMMVVGVFWLKQSVKVEV